MKYKTVREGQQAVLFNYLGEGKLLVGPKRVFLCRDRLEYLERHTASHYEYLVLKDIHGVITHKPGPCEVFCNPMELQNVSVAEATRIPANYVAVVYKKDGSKVERRIVQGPAVFMPSAEEWFHNFVWHGPDTACNQVAQNMLPAKRQFALLPMIAEQFYYDVRDVRTKDDTTITVKTMVSYGVQDIIKMLEETADPIADMINSVCADVIKFAGCRSYATFVHDSSKLNDVGSYLLLRQTTKRIGFVVHKVVYLGYVTTATMQEMHDNAIEKRTVLRLNQEVADMEQRLKECQLTSERERLQKGNEIENLQLAHQQRMDSLKQEHELALTAKERELQRRLEEEEEFVRREAASARQKQEVAFLGELKQLNVDVTSYLVSKQPLKANQLIMVDSPASSWLT